MPSVSKDLEGQQQDMARLIASVGASGSQNIGQAQAGTLKASMMPLIDAKGLAQIARYGRDGARAKAGVTPISSGTTYDAPTIDDVTQAPRYSTATFPGAGTYASTYGYPGGYDPGDLYRGWYSGWGA
jgi:hypothetical protein